MNVTCLVIRCPDKRFAQDSSLLLRNLDPGVTWREIVREGGVKNLVDPEDPKDATDVLRQLDELHRENAFALVVLINHLECGAYGSAAEPSELRQRQIGDLVKAGIVIEQRFPHANIVKMLARIDAGMILFEKVP